SSASSSYRSIRSEIACSCWRSLSSAGSAASAGSTRQASNRKAKVCNRRWVRRMDKGLADEAATLAPGLRRPCAGPAGTSAGMEVRGPAIRRLLRKATSLSPLPTEAWRLRDGAVAVDEHASTGGDQARTIWTVGHSTRSWEEFIALLRAHDIQAIADVRRFPGSRRYPWFA